MNLKTKKLSKDLEPYVIGLGVIVTLLVIYKFYKK
jgi:hypothetical protein